MYNGLQNWVSCQGRSHGNSSRIKQLQVQKNSYQKDHVDKITNHNGWQEHRFGRTLKHFKENPERFKCAIRCAKRKFDKNIAQNGNKKPFTSYIKSKTKSRTNVGLLRFSSEMISDDKERAMILKSNSSMTFMQHWAL